MALCLGCHAQAQSLTNCPGVVLSHIPSPSVAFGSAVNPVYVADPCILVLSNGHYLASHALFGSASGSGTSGKTRIFRSVNKGATWTQVNGGAELNGILRGTLFEHGGAVYLLGANKDTSGTAVIAKSTDGGVAWATPSSLAPNGGMATPDHVLPANGRLWAATTTTAVSAAFSAELSSSASWTRPGGFPAASGSWLPGTGFNATTNFIGEGQMTYSAGEGLVILPKVRLLSYTAIARVNPTTGTVTFDPDRDFVRLPGGEKKFGVRYDAVSGKYYLLGNPILPAHAGSSIARDLIRNTGAVFTSTDLRQWKLEKVFLYSPNIDYEGFQYFNFDFDGGDIVIASRTAFDVGGNRPPRGHDSNLLTFHRLANFRNLTRDLYLKLESGQVRLYERTLHRDAPLGDFPLGTNFDGQALTNPVAMGVNSGTVYIRESAGRILSFDLRGSFLGVIESAPVALGTSDLDLPVSAAEESAWNLAGSGAWRDPDNWRDWNVPGSPDDMAVFGSAVTSTATITLNAQPIAWSFDTATSFEGWTPVNTDSPAVTGGALTGLVQANGDPHITRTSLNFSGSSASEVRVRMRINATGDVPVDVFWGNSTSDSFDEARRARVNYSGNGAFQDVVFATSTLPGWNGERITRLRVDPANGGQFAGKLFEIDSVSVTIPDDVQTITGLRFTGPGSYTVAGNGILRMAPASGSAQLESLRGNHTVALPLQLGAETIASVGAGSALTISGPLSGDFPLTKGGSGTLLLTGATTRNSATTVNEGKLAFTSPQLNGTVRLATGASLELAFTGIDAIGELWLDGVQKWKGTWGAPGSGAAYETSTISGAGTLTVTAGPEPGYAGWAWQTGLGDATAGSGAPDSDPDNDMLANALEWILGGNPLTSDAAICSPQASVVGNKLVITFSRNDDSEVSAPCHVEYSTDLEIWSEVAVGATSSGLDSNGIVVAIDENGSAPDSVAVTLPFSLSTQPRLFARMRTVLD